MNSEDSSIICDGRGLERLQHRIHKNLEIHLPKIRTRPPDQLFSPAWFGLRLANYLGAMEPNIIHLHWTQYATLNIEEVKKLQRPIVWTLHDMWPMTGGCHYAGDCIRYQEACGRCSVLRSSCLSDLSARVHRRKREAWEDVDLHLVAPSRWIGSCARQSSLFRNRPITVIPNGIDTEIFRLVGREVACRGLGIDSSTINLAFVAVNATSDARKGFSQLLEALHHLATWATQHQRFRLLVAGADQKDLPRDLPFPTLALGNVESDFAMAQVYAAADVFVAPSLEDNLPNTVLESLACGTPVVAFAIGGMPDMISDGENGRLAPAQDAAGLAEGIRWVIEDVRRHDELRANARKTVEDRFTLKAHARAVSELYRSILTNR